MSLPRLIPVDRKRCQAEKPTGPFRMGGPAFTRCSGKPKVIATEFQPGSDGRKGAMSLCAACQLVLIEQMGPLAASFKEIR